MSVVEPIRVTLQVQENSPITVNSNILPKIIEGISPEVSLEETADGVVMTVTDKSGTETALIPKGPQGDDYVLTEEDKTEIATQAAEMVDVTGKADKVTGATNGNFAGLDANGNLTDSGSKASDFLTSHQDISGKADKADTVLTTTLSLGRQANTTVGTGSVALGTKLEASGDYSLAQGYSTHATAAYAHSEGMGTYAEAGYTHAEGGWTHAKKYGAHAEGGSTVADAPYSHTEGYGTKAAGTSQHVSGEYNVVNAPAAGEDYAEFVEIVGNGDGDNDRSNARTLDWDGNERLKGDLYIGCNSDSTGGTAVGTALAGKQAKITASGLLKGDGNGGVTAATAGTDYGTYSKPSGGIPAEDMAAGVIPDPTSIIDDTAGASDTDKVWSADKSARLLNAITAFDDFTEYVNGKNMINPETVEVGRMTSTGGVNASYTSWRTSDFIWLESGDYIFARESLTNPGTSIDLLYYYSLYDANKEFITGSYTTNNTNQAVTVTVENACYIRICCAATYYTEDTYGRIILQAGTELDGYEAYFKPYRKVVIEYEQESGESTETAMSQKAVTDYVADYVAENADLDEFAPLVVGKNKYNPVDCNPQNGKYYDTNGIESAAALYAITGKIPVDAETVYTFSATSFSIQYARPYYFGGENGETFLSREENFGVTTFTTPENCTFVAINLFGRTHTDSDFDNMIAVAQLENGNTATAYEPYERKRMIYPDNIVGGDKISGISNVTGTESLINLYDKSIAKDNRYFNKGTEASANTYAHTGKIPVKPNTQYILSNDESATKPLSTAVYMFDCNGNFLRMANFGGYPYSYALSFSTDSDVYFIACNIYMGNHTQQEFENAFAAVMLCYGTARPKTFAPYNPEAVLLHDKFDDQFFRSDPFVGKRWLACGTSITWYDSKAYQAGLHSGEICRGYVGNVARRKKLLVTNEGISGSTLADVSSSSLINRYQDLDWENADIATLEYGVNDFGHAVDIGTAEDAPGTTTFAACLKTIIEYALTQNPKLCLVICTEPDVRGNTANSGGHYLYEFTEVTLAIAKQYRLPVCDWYYHCGINAVTKGSSSVDLLTADGTHPNDAGHLRMGAMLNQVFDSLIC